MSNRQLPAKENFLALVQFRLRAECVADIFTISESETIEFQLHRQYVVATVGSVATRHIDDRVQTL